MLRFVLVAAVPLLLSEAAFAQCDTWQAPSQIDAAIASGYHAVEEGDYALALRVFEPLAKCGVALAQNNLGAMYGEGRGVPKDEVAAARWYAAAAAQGQSTAQANLGWFFWRGIVFRRDPAEAERYFRLSAAQGDQEGLTGLKELASSDVIGAQVSLGDLYYNGTGVSRDYDEAMRWWLRAAGSPNTTLLSAVAKYKVGSLLALGYSSAEPNDALAAALLLRGADAGIAHAQFVLANMYADGRGVPENYTVALKWLLLSSASGYEAARDMAVKLKAYMTGTQIAEAQSQAEAWRPTLFDEAASQGAGSPAKPAGAIEISSTGTGFFVSSDRHVVTNAHVVSGCSILTTNNGLTLRLLDTDEAADLALLTADAGPPRSPLYLRQGRGVRLADSVLVAGYPLTGLLSSELNATLGSVSALSGPGNDRRIFQITAPVQPGNSGGPVIDASGNLVGVVVSKLDALEVARLTGDIPQNVNFAVSLGALLGFLDANAVDYATRASTAPKSNADVAEIARAATVQIECRN
jgi:TPR repeat protein